MITFDHITFCYNNEPIFNDFSLSVEKGERVAVKGESGTGKTTLFLLLLGFEFPVAGGIFIEGIPHSDKNFSTLRRRTAWLPQDLNIGDGSVGEVIGRPFEFRFNQPKKPEAEKVETTLISLGLNGSVLDKKFRDLSTGQRQRVGLALCHLLDRHLLLLDEPTSALDRASQEKAAELLFADPDRTIISTTHDPFWIDKFDRVYSLD